MKEIKNRKKGIKARERQKKIKKEMIKKIIQRKP